MRVGIVYPSNATTKRHLIKYFVIFYDVYIMDCLTFKYFIFKSNFVEDSISRCFFLNFISETVYSFL